VLESAASGEIAEIYSDIRATLGTSVVNLVCATGDNTGCPAMDLVDGAATLFGRCVHAEAGAERLACPRCAAFGRHPDRSRIGRNALGISDDTRQLSP